MGFYRASATCFEAAGDCIADFSSEFLQHFLPAANWGSQKNLKNILDFFSNEKSKLIKDYNFFNFMKNCIYFNLIIFVKKYIKSK